MRVASDFSSFLGVTITFWRLYIILCTKTRNLHIYHSVRTVLPHYVSQNGATWQLLALPYILMKSFSYKRHQ